jgi:hypothetical protein
VYSDASGREGHLGAAAAALNDSLETIDSMQVQVGDSGRSHPRVGCSPVSESDLVDDVDSVQDPNQLGGMTH